MDYLSSYPRTTIPPALMLRLSKHPQEEDTIGVVIEDQEEEGPVGDEGHAAGRVGEAAEHLRLDRTGLGALLRELDHHLVHAVLHLQAARGEEASHVGLRGEEVLDAQADESLGRTAHVMVFPIDILSDLCTTCGAIFK